MGQERDEDQLWSELRELAGELADLLRYQRLLGVTQVTQKPGTGKPAADPARQIPGAPVRRPPDRPAGAEKVRERGRFPDRPGEGSSGPKGPGEARGRLPVAPEKRAAAGTSPGGPPRPAESVCRLNPALAPTREEALGCTRCPLSRTRTQVVFGTGNEHATLVFVGEGPGADEDLQGKPFVGRAGQLLTRLLQEIGLRREEVYITNVVKCRPPNNRNPEPDEIAACEPYLIRQLEIIRPRLICTLGGVAAQTLLKTQQTISRLRGRFHLRGDQKVLPTYHPAYLLRNPAQMKVVQEDFQLLKREYEKLMEEKG